MTTWVVCARKDQARIFECTSLDEGLRFLDDWPGTVSGSLTTHLISAVKLGACDNLVLCAEHGVLASLRSILEKGTNHRIAGEVQQDLYDSNESDLIPHVASHIIDAHRAAA